MQNREVIQQSCASPDRKRVLARDLVKITRADSLRFGYWTVEPRMFAGDIHRSAGELDPALRDPIDEMACGGGEHRTVILARCQPEDAIPSTVPARGIRSARRTTLFMNHFRILGVRATAICALVKTSKRKKRVAGAASCSESPVCA